MTQIMNLLNLAPDIQESILWLPPTSGRRITSPRSALNRMFRLSSGGNTQGLPKTHIGAEIALTLSPFSKRFRFPLALPLFHRLTSNFDHALLTPCAYFYMLSVRSILV